LPDDDGHAFRAIALPVSARSARSTQTTTTGGGISMSDGIRSEDVKERERTLPLPIST
jgi:hypothetical protein